MKNQELEGLNRFAKDARQEIGVFHEQNEDLSRQLSHYQTENSTVKNELKHVTDAENERLSKFRENYETATRQLQEVRSKMKPLEYELETEKRKRTDVTRELNQAKNQIRSLQSENEKARNEVSRVQEERKDSAFKERQFEGEMQKEKSLLLQKERNLVDMEQKLKSNENHYSRLKKENDELRAKQADLNKQIFELNHQLQCLGNDLLSQSQSRGNEKKLLDDKIVELRNELLKTNEEYKNREREQTGEMKRKAEDFNAIRKNLEDTTLHLQNEYKKLHEIVSTLQTEKKEQLSAFQRERDDFNETIYHLKSKVKDSEVKFSIFESDAKKEKNDLSAEVQELKHLVATQVADFNNEIHNLRTLLRNVSEENHVLQSSYNDSIEEINNLMADIENNKNFDEASISEWHKEAQKSVILVFEDNITLKSKCNRIHEDVVKLNVGKDAEIAKSLMLEEELQRLRDDLTLQVSKYQMIEENYKQKLDQVAIEKGDMETIHSEVNVRIGKVKKQLEEANTQNRMLIEEKQTLLEELKTAQSNTHLLKNRNKQEVDELDDKYREQIADKNNLLSELEMLKTDFREKKRSLEEAQNELKRRTTDHHQLEEKYTGMKQTFERDLKAARQNGKNYQKQLNHTKGLLTVVQDARKRLQEENAMLRSEVDEVLNKTLAGTTPIKDGSQRLSLFSHSLGRVPDSVEIQSPAAEPQPEQSSTYQASEGSPTVDHMDSFEMEDPIEADSNFDHELSQLKEDVNNLRNEEPGDAAV